MAFGIVYSSQSRVHVHQSYPPAVGLAALALGEREGLVKTIFDARSGELVGAHMIGAEVTELIQGFVIAMQLEATEEDLMRTVFPHPTLSEMMGESALAAYGRALHIPPAGKPSS